MGELFELREHQEKALDMLRRSIGVGRKRPLLYMRFVMNESWVPVVGYEGFYEVSDLGRVRRVPRYVIAATRWGTISRRFISGGLLTPTVDRAKDAYGRLQVKLCVNNTPKTYLLHRLVMAAFVGNCPDGQEVAHIDGNAANNHLSNLRYATPKENSADKFLHGTVLRGSDIGNSKLKLCDVQRIRELRGRHRVCDLAKRFGISQAQVSRIQNGLCWVGAGQNE